MTSIKGEIMKHYILSILLFISCAARAAELESIQVESLDTALNDARRKNDVNSIRNLLKDAKTLRATLKNAAEQKKLERTINSIEAFLKSVNQGAKPAGRGAQPSENEQFDRVRLDSIKEAFDKARDLSAKQQIAKDAPKQLDELKSLEAWEKESLIQYMKDEISRLAKMASFQPSKEIPLKDLYNQFRNAKNNKNLDQLREIYAQAQKYALTEKERVPGESERMLQEIERAIIGIEQEQESRTKGAKKTPEESAQVPQVKEQRTKEELQKKENDIVENLEQRFSTARRGNYIEEMEKIYSEAQDQLPKLSTIEKTQQNAMLFDMRNGIRAAKAYLEFRKYGVEGAPTPVQAPSLSRETSAEFDERMRRYDIESLPPAKQSEQKITASEEPKKEEAQKSGFGYFEPPVRTDLAIKDKYALLKQFGDTPERAAWKALAELYPEFKYPSRFDTKESDQEYAEQLVKWVLTMEDIDKIDQESDKVFHRYAGFLSVGRSTADKGVQLAKAYFYEILARNINDVYNWLKSNKLFKHNDDETVNQILEQWERKAEDLYPAGNFWWKKYRH